MVSKLIPVLASETGLNSYDIHRIVSSAPSRYKTYLIEKRDGDYRSISQPAREVKILQRILVDKVLSTLPVHPAATAYRRAMSIRDNAAAHTKNGPILKFDFKDFFPSLTEYDWKIYCTTHAVFEDKEDVDLSVRILFRRSPYLSGLRLAIGAPSSPLLSNILLNDFDEKVTRAVAADQVTYTRYADDLTFSARRTGYLTRVDKALRSIIREMRSPSLRINEAKTVSATKKYKRFVTGLVLTNDGEVSLGRDKKRHISAAVHHAANGRMDYERLAELSGTLAYVNAVEPEFLNRLRRKYGDEVIRTIKSARLAQRPVRQ